MPGDTESKDRREARTLALVLIGLGVGAFVAALLAWPLLADFHAGHLAPGLGMRAAAVISFLVTIVVLIVFALVAGEGLIGELQFMLLGFFAFFLILWLLIGWIF